MKESVAIDDAELGDESCRLQWIVSQAKSGDLKEVEELVTEEWPGYAL